MKAQTTRRTSLLRLQGLLLLPLIVALGGAIVHSVRNLSDGTLFSSGELRDYLLFVPASYDPEQPTPLVFSLHGVGGTALQQRKISQWDRVAEREGFLVVYPNGASGTVRAWRARENDAAAKDVHFFRELIDELSKSYNIDPTRIYANGLSNGGGMSVVLSCALTDRIAAVGLVAPALTMPWSWCADSKPMPMIAFHGTEDSATPYHGGETWVGDFQFPSILTWTENWARRNRCSGAPLETLVAADVSHSKYLECSESNSVELYTIHGGGHTWPGGLPLPRWFLGKTTQSIDASQLMWDFFRRHRRQTSSAQR